MRNKSMPPAVRDGSRPQADAAGGRTPTRGGQRLRNWVATIPLALLLLIPALPFTMTAVTSPTVEPFGAPAPGATWTVIDGGFSAILPNRDPSEPPFVLDPAPTPLAPVVDPTAPPQILPTEEPTLGPTPAPTPRLTAKSTPPSAKPKPKPAPRSQPRLPSGSLAMLGNNLLARPTSGPAWSSLKSAADASEASPDFGDQNNKAVVQAVAAALVYRRTGQTSYRDKAIRILEKYRAQPSSGNDSLGLFRPSGGIGMAAWLAGWDSAAARSFLRAYLNYQGDHSRWRTIRGTAANAVSNYNAWPLAGLASIGLALNDRTLLDEAWRLFTAWGKPYAQPWQPTAAFQPQRTCLAMKGGKVPVGINPASCGSGPNGSGALIEDAARSPYPTIHSGYATETFNALTVAALALSQAGYPAWTVNDSQMRRVANWMSANVQGGLNYYGGSHFTAYVINRAYGTSYPEKRPTSGGRTFGFTDFLFG
jgi:hypothetical protein